MDLKLGAHIRWLISRGLYPRANIRGPYIRGLCPGGLNPGAAGGLYTRAYIRGAYIRVLIFSDLYPGDLYPGGLYSTLTY